MDASAQDGGEIFEATAFLGYFKDLTDTRQPGKVVYPLDEVSLLALLATLAGAETVTDMARFGEKSLPSCAVSARARHRRGDRDHPRHGVPAHHRRGGAGQEG